MFKNRLRAETLSPYQPPSHWEPRRQILQHLHRSIDSKYTYYHFSRTKSQELHSQASVLDCICVLYDPYQPACQSNTLCEDQKNVNQELAQRHHTEARSQKLMKCNILFKSLYLLLHSFMSFILCIYMCVKHVPGHLHEHMEVRGQLAAADFMDDFHTV